MAKAIHRSDGQIDAGKYQAVNTDITDKNFPSTRKGQADLRDWFA